MTLMSTSPAPRTSEAARSSVSLWRWVRRPTSVCATLSRPKQRHAGGRRRDSDALYQYFLRAHQPCDGVNVERDPVALLQGEVSTVESTWGCTGLEKIMIIKTQKVHDASGGSPGRCGW